MAEPVTGPPSAPCACRDPPAPGRVGRAAWAGAGVRAPVPAPEPDRARVRGRAAARGPRRASGQARGREPEREAASSSARVLLSAERGNSAGYPETETGTSSRCSRPAPDLAGFLETVRHVHRIRPRTPPPPWMRWIAATARRTVERLPPLRGKILNKRWGIRLRGRNQPTTSSAPHRRGSSAAPAAPRSDG